MKYLVKIFFDINDREDLENRDYDMFILEFEEGHYKETMLRYFEEMKYSWGDSEKFKMGYKMIMTIETTNLTNLKVYR